MPQFLDERLLGQWARARLAHEAVMLEDAQQVLRQARAGVRGHDPATAESPAAAEESMIHIGDQIQHHHAPPASGLNQLAKIALAAGLLATGVGLPAGAWMLASALQRTSETRIEKQIERWDATVDMQVEPPQ